MTRLLLQSALFAAMAMAQSAGPYRIAGVVVDSEGGSPVPRARVVLLRTGTTQVVARQIAGTDGRFAFDVPEGKFHLEASVRDMALPYGIHKSDARMGTSIITGPDQDTSHLVFRWFPPGAISGKITDEAGDPVESALVQLLRSVVTGGRRVVRTAGWVRTDDRGEYRFGPLSGGEYLLAVTGTPWYSHFALPGRENPEPTLAYAPTYYPNTTDISGASILALKPGQEARADFKMAVVRGSKVIVKHDAPPEMKGMIALVTDGVGGSDGFQRQEIFVSLQQAVVVAAVPPGRYLVRMTGSKGSADFSGRRLVDVNGSDLNVEIEMRPMPKVSGTVQLKNPKAKPRGALLASLIRDDTGLILSTVVHADGSFSFPAVAVAKYQLAIRGADGYFATDIHAEGTHFENGVVDLAEGESVSVKMSASDEIGGLQGFVMRGEKPLEGVLVVLAPARNASDQSAYRGFQTDSDGSFDYQNVPAGDYLLFATEDTGIEYANPSAIRSQLTHAKAVRIEAHVTATERITLGDAAAEKQP
jgi:hypothetical protein